MAKKKTETKLKEKKVKETKPKVDKGRKDYPLAKDHVISELPAGFDFTKHKTIKRANWDADWMHMEHRVAELRWKADVLEEKAKEAQTLGGKKERNKAKSLKKMQEKMAELRKELEASGIDVDELLS